MPTELPKRRTASDPSVAGNPLILAVGILLMLIVSVALLLHPEDVAAGTFSAPVEAH